VDPPSVDRDLAKGAFALAALKGDTEFFGKLIAAMQTPKSPEEYYIYFFTLPQFADPMLLHKTLEYSISSDVRSQDVLQLVTSVLANPDGQRLAWDFIRQHWTDLEKAGGPFAGAQVVGETSDFCDAGLRDQVIEFFTAHKVAAAERTYKQSIERINNCVDLKSQQASQLASWLGQHGSSD
jgi:aminopeptidase N